MQLHNYINKKQNKDKELWTCETHAKCTIILFALKKSLQMWCDVAACKFTVTHAANIKQTVMATKTSLMTAVLPNCLRRGDSA